MVSGNILLRLRPFLGIIAMAGVRSHEAQDVTSNDTCPRVESPFQTENTRNSESTIIGNTDTTDENAGNYVHYELRYGQTLNIISTFNNSEVYLCAPEWVKEGIKTLQSKTGNIKSLHIDISGHSDSSGVLGSTAKQKTLSIDRKISWLQLLSRNERFNVDGVTKLSLYAPALTDQSIIISLKDLTRQTIIVGEAYTTHYGGYGCELKPQSAKVYICDLSALQFQEEENTGRLVLLRQDPPLSSGILDDLIYENVVGESRSKFEEIVHDKERFIPVCSQIFGDVLFDIKAYKSFVAQDVIVAGLAIDHVAGHKKDKIHFKFLKYGTGYFAGDFRAILDYHILDAVLDGLEELFDTHRPVWIKSVELPFYKLKDSQEERVTAFQTKQGVKIRFSKDDALKSNADPLILATTNCGDPHTVFGNEMSYGSVDAAIAENLKDKGYRFSPLLNGQMNEKYFSVKNKSSKI